jgi:4-amino-4-deoxy-L-arabinose transferase-like glycosyltransferase
MLILLSKPWLKTFFIGAGVLILVLTAMQFPLLDQDEGAYASFAQQMVRSGNYSVPTAAWSDVHRKPPLMFWMMAACYRLFGENEFATRLPSMLGFCLAGLFLSQLGPYSLGWVRAQTAGNIVFFSPFLLVFGSFGYMDAMLVACHCLALVSVLNYMHRPKWIWLATLVLANATGLLLKGPPVLVVTLGMLGLLLFSSKRRLAFRMMLWLPLAVLPMALWLFSTWQADGGVFVRWLADWYVLSRLRGEVLFGQKGPPGYHAVVMLLVFFPFVWLLPEALRRLVRKLRTNRDDTVSLVLLGALLSGWIAYEIIPSKLPSYGFGAIPAFAVLLSFALSHYHMPNWSRNLGLTLYGILFVALTGGLFWLNSLSEVFPPERRLAMLGGILIWVLLGGAALGMLGAGRRQVAVMLLLGQVLALHLLVIQPVRGIVGEKLSTSKNTAIWINQHRRSFDQIVMGGNLQVPSMAFYLNTMSEQFELQNDETLLAERVCGNEEPAILVTEPKILKGLNTRLGEKCPRIKLRNQIKSIKGWSSDRGVVNFVVYQLDI